MFANVNSLASRRVVRRFKLVRNNPRHRWQFPILNIRRERCGGFNVLVENVYVVLEIAEEG
jgi:hypothetical protein